MKELLKKNQLMITALAIMIAVAGYLQFAEEGLSEEDYLTGTSDSQTASGGVVENLTSEDMSGTYDLLGLLDLSEEDLELAGMYSGTDETSGLTNDAGLVADGGVGIQDVESLDIDIETPEEGEIPGDAVFTSGLGIIDFSEVRLLKEQTRAKNKETLMEIINSAGLTDVQKQSAVDTMVRMTEIAEMEMAAEILLEAKGFSGVIVSVNGNTVDVVVNAVELTDAQRAQIEDIVKRKTAIDATNIVISTVVQ
ncbi:MAG: SpoIIIAH-like family protein [Lachnospiraceae bacterium]|nr:SpoIIIAH-like family protein [Lachnospiraceae bacterium]